MFEKTKNKRKRGRGRPIFKIKNFFTPTPGHTVGYDGLSFPTFCIVKTSEKMIGSRCDRYLKIDGHRSCVEDKNLQAGHVQVRRCHVSKAILLRPKNFLSRNMHSASSKQCDQKKSPNVYISCIKMISLEK